MNILSLGAPAPHMSPVGRSIVRQVDSSGLITIRRTPIMSLPPDLEDDGLVWLLLQCFRFLRVIGLRAFPRNNRVR